jgi:hypothetical protein
MGAAVDAVCVGARAQPDLLGPDLRPDRMDLARTTFIPGPALVMYPITRVLGPLV